MSDVDEQIIYCVGLQLSHQGPFFIWVIYGLTKISSRDGKAKNMNPNV
jgi:hypothetical protein